MATLESRLITYLESLMGDRPDLQGESTGRGAQLPLYLRERYDLKTARLFGRLCHLAIEKPDWDAGSPSEYRGHSDQLRAAFEGPVALVLPVLPSYTRNRLVRSGVPFTVPGTQLFLPSLLVDLREQFPQSAPEPGKRLTPAAQCILLYHLLRGSLSDLTLREIAGKVGYSAMMVTRAKDELEANALCESTRKGRSVLLTFAEDRRALWDQAQPLLTSPVRKSHWIQWKTPGDPALMAGLTALSRQTMIEDDRLPTYALPHQTFLANLGQGTFRGCREPEDADLRLEAWSYNPLLLGGNEMVDSLSLYLSLRDSADERVQQQFEHLIAEVHWA